MFEKNDVCKKNDCSRRMDKYGKVASTPQNPTWSILLRILLLMFFLRKTVLITKSTEKCLARTTALARTIASCENDLWLRCARERCNIASQGGDWLWSYHIYVLPNMSSNTAHENDEWLDMRFPTASHSLERWSHSSLGPVPGPCQGFLQTRRFAAHWGMPDICLASPQSMGWRENLNRFL